MAAVGLALLTQVETDSGFAALITASVVISLGLAPVFGLTTELIVGSAPEERAGAASGISETGSELGGALGIAILGSVGVAIYRSALGSDLPAGIPPAAVAAAQDTLGAAVGVADVLPGALGSELLEAAQNAFVVGMQLSSGIAAVVAVVLAGLALVMLRGQAPTSEAWEDTTDLAEETRSEDT